MSFANASVVEPAHKSIFILLDGLGAKNEGLNESGCKLVEETDAFGHSGVANELKKIAGEANVFYRPYLNPAESPAKLAREFAERGRAKVETQCEYYKRVGSIMDDAVEHWFQVNLDRVASGNIETENMLHVWILTWKKAKGKLPSLENLQLNRSDLIPSSFVVIADGMGGMVAREYIQSADYKGEIANVIFFDTPHEGTGFADQALLSKNAKYKTISKSKEKLSAAIPLVLVAYLAGSDGALRTVLTNLLKEIVLGMAANLGDDVGAAQKDLFEKFDNDAALWYLTQDANFRDKQYASAFKNAPSGVGNLIGSVQYLNEASKSTDFAHPNYNIVVSSGFPTIGNGRRTLDDFKDQNKFHVSNEKLAQILADSLRQNANVPVNEEQLKAIEEFSKNLVNENAVDVSQIQGLFGDAAELQNKAKSYISDFEDLRSLSLNINDLPATTRKILHLLDKYIPDEFKSELMASIIDEFSPEFKSLVESSEYISKGMAVNAGNLANYKLNFYDQGRFDVPSYSALGNDVRIFKETHVNRLEYSLANMNNDSLKYLKDLLDEIGKMEYARSVTDAALASVCEKLVDPYRRICKAAEFATNVTLIADISTKTSRFAKNIGKLKASKNTALAASVLKKQNFKDSSHVAVYSDLEGMLFTNPHISFRVVDSANAVVPLLFYKGTKKAVDTYEELKNIFGDSTKFKYPSSIDREMLSNANLQIPSGAEAVTLQVIEGGFSKRTALKNLPAFITTDFVEEMHFVVEDFSPSEMWYVTIDFNSEIQFVFERDADGWFVKMNRFGKWGGLHRLSESPIRKDGLFIFNLVETLKICDVTDLKLSAIEREGPNLVTLHGMNKVGKLSNQQFSFFIQSTTPYMQEGFPASLQYVNALDSVYIHLSNLGNPYKVYAAKAYLLKGSDTVYTNTVNVTEIANVQGDSAWEQKWLLSAKFTELKANAKLKDGMYTLLWHVETSPLAAGAIVGYNMFTNVYLDRTPPKIEIALPNRNLKNSAGDGFWGSIVNTDSSAYFALQSIRSYVKIGNEKYEIASAENYGGTELRFNWNGLENKLPNGKALLVAEAYDFAGNVKNVSDTIWIDNEAPSVVENTVQFTVAKNTSDTIKVNAETLLKLEFDIAENLLGRSSERVQVMLYFDDLDSIGSKLFVNDTVTNDQLHFVFEEPEMRKLLDGVYDIGIVLMDEAGNVSEKKILKQTLVVDRTAPVVGSFMLNAPVVTSFKELTSGIAYLSQVHDHVRNRSALDCKWKLVSDVSMPWQDACIEKNNAAGKENALFAVLFENLDSLPNGRYVAHFGCYDAAGNFGSNIDVVSVGFRHPEITYPLSEMDSTVNFENIVISGIAPDPILPGGNEQTATFKIEWRLDSLWSENGITYLQQMVDPYERKLAIWNRSKLSKGDYEIRLTVCNQKNADTICTSDIQKVYLNDVLQKSSMKLVLETPQNGQRAGDSTKISIRLDGGADTLNWRIDARVEVTNPKNINEKIPGTRFVKETADVSPFAGNIEKYKNGLSVFQDANGIWNLHWQGAAERVDKAIEPRLLLKFNNAATKFNNVVNAVKDSSVRVESIDAVDFRIPGYDAVYAFELRNFENGLHLQFSTDSAFTVDISSVLHADSITYCGKNSVPKYEAIPKLANSKMLFVDPELYKTSFYWNGFTMAGLYPEKGFATLYVVATSNQENAMAVVDSVSWPLTAAPVQIVSEITKPGMFVISRGSDSNEVITLGNGNFGYEFGLKNQKAKVSAYVLNDSNERIKTLFVDNDYVAGKSLDAYSLSWNGTTDNGFVATSAGNYFINVIAVDSEGNRDSILYPFSLQYAGSLLPAPTTFYDSLEKPAELIMEEAYKDANGELRYVGRADYELRAIAQARFLPDSERVFKYKWAIDSSKSYQTPAVYEASRFSLGIRRQRHDFEVAVVTLVATTGYKLKNPPEAIKSGFLGLVKDLADPVGFVDDVVNGCDEYDTKYIYTMRLQKMKFSVDGYSGGEFLNTQLMHHGFDIVAKDKSKSYGIHFAVKVFPVTEYDGIKQNMGNVDSLIVEYARGKVKDKGLTFKDLFHTDIVDDHLKQWNNDFGVTKIWSVETPDFLAEEYNKNLRSGQKSGACTVDDNNPDKFVCGGKNAKDADITSFNPHADMFTLSVESYFDDILWSGTKCSNKGYKNIPVTAKLRVNIEYWEPNFGYNNLANRFTRFDHSNKVLYGSEGYFASLPKNVEYWNYHSGDNYEQNSNYGLVTPFETQRFMMANVEENPLLFTDEILIGNQDSSRYTVSFLGNGNSEKYKAVIVRSVGNHVISSELNEKFEDEHYYNPMNFEILVAQNVNASAAIKNDSVHLPYPYKKSASSPKISNICEDSKIRNVNKCNKFYLAASRLHYGLNDWNDSLWLARFANPDSTMKNVVTSEFCKGCSQYIYNFKPLILYNPFTTGVDERKKELSFKIANNLNEDKWYVQSQQLTRIELSKSMAKLNYKMHLRPVSVQKNWHVEEDKNGSLKFWNEGVLLKDSVRYVRMQDSTQRNSVSDEQNVLKQNIMEQNPSCKVWKDGWFKHLSFNNVKILDRDSLKLHKYFIVDTLPDAKGFLVKRNGEFPKVREKEIVSLIGRVPGKNASWTLSYLKNGKIMPLENGVQKNADALHNLAKLNVNTLQGNTSFFLTYGGSEGNVFFKQMDVHIGEYVTRKDTNVVRSMYGDTKIQFMPESYESDVDVTVRNVGMDEMNAEFPNNLAPVGAVIEVLPSYVFKDSTKWPRVQVTIPKKNLENQDPRDLKIYKVDFATKTLVPLEQIEKVFLDTLEKDVGISGKWDHVLVSGLTRTFSTFAVFDSSYANSVNDAIHETSSNELNCSEMESGSVWMGVENGYLEYPSPCAGNGVFLLQLRTGRNVALEYQGELSEKIHWEVRKEDLQITENMFDSRFAIFDMDGSVKQWIGPVVFVDSAAPSVEELSVNVLENGTSRRVEVNALLDDMESGVKNAVVDLYLANQLVESRSIDSPKILAEDFDIKRSVLNECFGCDLQVVLTAYDHGHNYTKRKSIVENLNSYPSSLVLWYPMQEGSGNIAREMMHSGLDLSLLNMDRPWVFGNGLYLYSTSDSMTSEKTLGDIGEVPFSIEFTIKPSAMSKDEEYSIVGFEGNKPWQFGVAKNRRYFFEYNGSGVTFNLSTTMSVQSHFVLSIEGNKIMLYKDGILQDTKTLRVNMTWNGSGRVVLGRFKGLQSARAVVSNLRLYKEALTASQVSSVYNNSMGIDENASYSIAARAIDLPRSNMNVDLSCEVPGAVYLKQNSTETGVIKWNVDVHKGANFLYVYARGLLGSENGIEVFVNGKSRGVFKVPSTGTWDKFALSNLQFESNGSFEISFRPLLNTEIAGVALADASVPNISFGEDKWDMPSPRVDVKTQYVSADDKTWIRPKMEIRNLTGTTLSNVRARYYYKGEGEDVSAVAFYPAVPMKIVHEAGSTYYSELSLNEPIGKYGTAYYGNGPQFGLHRNDYSVWYKDDDPGFENGVLLLDSIGMPLNSWNCFAGDAPAKVSNVKLQALTADLKNGSNQGSNLKVVVENVGTVPSRGLEVRYYLRDTSKIQLDTYYAPRANVSLQNAGGDLWYVSMIYDDLILNPGEKNEGANFELHYPDWHVGFDASDDPSHFGVVEELSVADSVVILDRNGNLLWGNVPMPRFNQAKVVRNVPGVITKDGENLYVMIEQSGVYELNIVNAIGIPVKRVFSGNWNVGEHLVTLKVQDMQPGNYIVLSKDNEVFAWTLLK